MGRKDKSRIVKFCSNEHKLAYETERVLGPTGSFRPLIEEYLSAGAPNMYRQGTLPTVRVSLAKFFRFVARTEKMSQLEAIGPGVVTRFIAHERERGFQSQLEEENDL